MGRTGRALGIGCGLFVLLGICTSFTSCYVCVPLPAREAAHAFLSDVRDREWSSALQRTSAEYQRRHDASALERAVRGIPRLDGHTSATLMNAAFDEGRATLDGTIATSDGEIPIGVELVEADGYWYVDAIAVQGVPLE